jgi:hypothetical protein
VTDPEKIALYDVVVAYKTDRYSRGTQEDFTRIEFWATQHGKRLVIVNGPQYPARADRFDSATSTATTRYQPGRRAARRPDRGQQLPVRSRQPAASLHASDRKWAGAWPPGNQPSAPGQPSARAART